jgi:hypothetical protein
MPTFRANEPVRSPSEPLPISHHDPLVMAGGGSRWSAATKDVHLPVVRLKVASLLSMHLTGAGCLRGTISRPVNADISGCRRKRPHTPPLQRMDGTGRGTVNVKRAAGEETGAEPAARFSSASPGKAGRIRSLPEAHSGAAGRV